MTFNRQVVEFRWIGGVFAPVSYEYILNTGK
jgi:hypothetical protein